ncbi:hypothetical protein TNCV_513061, partial [Trichonephila clavipes]
SKLPSTIKAGFLRIVKYVRISRIHCAATSVRDKFAALSTEVQPSVPLPETAATTSNSRRLSMHARIPKESLKLNS